MKHSDILISKSRYMAGLRCDKLLWCRYHDTDLFPDYSKSTLVRFAEGNRIGELAQRGFPGGKEAAPEKYLAEDTVPPTKELIKLRIPIYEAGFVHGPAYVKIDILNPVDEDEWDLYEVKSSTGYSSEKHLADVAIQRYAAEGSGIKIRRCYLMHINNQYVLQGALDPSALLKPTDVTTEVDTFISNVNGDLERMLAIIEEKECPDVAIGPHCNAIRTCDLHSVCWKDMPEHHVLTFYSDRKKLGYSYLAQGVTDLKDVVQDDGLSNKQKIQVAAVRTGQMRVDKEAVAQFLKKLEYPLSFLDFETIGAGIPLFEGMRPYRQIPFQYSLHVINAPGDDPVHYEFLPDKAEDPRPSLLEALKADLPTTGSVVAYSSSVEAGAIRNLAALDPSANSWAEDVISRMVDLLKPFSSFAVYHPDQNGSASMKSVLPALTGEGYDDMEVSGDIAGPEWQRITFKDIPPKEVAEVRQDLLDYCKLDTNGMVQIVEVLQKLVTD